MVPAITFQQIATAQEGIVQVEARRAPAGAFPDLAVKGDQEGGTPIALHHPRSNNPYHSRMPAIAHENEPGIALRVGCTFDLLECLVQNSLIQSLPFDVETL